MEENEIRLGNYAKYGVHIITIKSIHTDSVLRDETVVYVDINNKLKYKCLDILEIEPIPITEEWLLRFGLIKKKNNRFIHEELGFEVEIQGRFVAYVIWGRQDAPFLTKFIGHCEFVHEFQNLIFSLHKKELTTNPPRS